MNSTFAILFALYFIIINFIAYILMGIDKKKAVKKTPKVESAAPRKRMGLMLVHFVSRPPE